MTHPADSLRRKATAFTVLVLLLAAALSQALAAEPLPLQFSDEAITYKKTSCTKYNKLEPCSGYLSLSISDGSLLVAIHPEAAGSVTAPIVLNAEVATGKDTFGDTVRTATYLDENTTPYVQLRAIQQPAFISARHDRVVFGELMDQYLAALRAAGFQPTIGQGVNGNFVLLYPNGQADGTSITLYRSAGGVTARFNSPH